MTGRAVRSVARTSALFLTVTAGVFLPRVLSGQTVRGLVLDTDSGEPISLATVTLLSDDGERVASTLSDEQGFYSLDAPEDGIYALRTVVLGYRPGRGGPFELAEGGVQIVEMRMTPQPLDVEGLLVEGDRPVSGDLLVRSGFWERYGEGKGQFLTPGEVANSEAVFTPQLLRGLDHVAPQVGEVPWAVWPRFHQALGAEARPCVPRVYVDDRWINRPGWDVEEDFGLDDIVPLEFVRAVEVYWGPFQAPMRYQGPMADVSGSSSGACGVVLIWTHG